MPVVRRIVSLFEMMVLKPENHHKIRNMKVKNDLRSFKEKPTNLYNLEYDVPVPIKFPIELIDSKIVCLLSFASNFSFSLFKS